MTDVQIERQDGHRWRIARDGQMRVDGIVFTSEALLETVEDDALQQVANVATLPGIVDASYAMPDMHWGYGFPIGGVAATDVDEGGVVSPGGVGFDISCGVRLLATPLGRDEIGDALPRIMDILDRSVPRGLGKGAVWDIDDEGKLAEILVRGAAYAVDRGRGSERDLTRCEDGGFLEDADPSQVSSRAKERGLEQVGSLGSGNHFLEVQAVDELVDPDVADAFGVREGQVCVMIHTGSRGLGHQICQDHVRTMKGAMQDHGIEVPDKQLACAPVDSTPGGSYLRAMAAGANFGRANRQMLAEATRDAFEEVTGRRDLELVYDVSHNLAKVEEHDGRTLCVHRKGATLALPPGHDDLPDDLRPHGQPVLIPGSMGTSSWVLTGVEVEGSPSGTAFHSTCHGAGRTMSRTQAKKRQDGRELHDELEGQGVLVREESQRDLPEEAPYAYKDVDEVVRVCEEAQLARRVARLVPLGVVKG